MPNRTIAPSKRRQKHVQVVLTTDEHTTLREDADAKRLSMSGLLVSAWLQSRADNQVTVPLSSEHYADLVDDATKAGLTPWELLIKLWFDAREEDFSRDGLMRRRTRNRHNRTSART